MRVTQSTDQKVGGSSPSERAQLTGPLPVTGVPFGLPQPVKAAPLRGTAARPPPGSALGRPPGTGAPT